MSAPLYFLPWLRRGLGAELGSRDTGQPALPRGAPVPAWVQLDQQQADVSLALRPADHAIAIDATQIIRRYPEPNTVDAEHGYFPLIELAPDLPWVLTPAVADEAPDDAASTGRLRPWVVLVCVEDAEADYIAGEADRPARLVCPVEQLPDLAESYAWAHVQSIDPPSGVVAALADSPGSVISRLVCPRRLAASTRYRAAVVLAFTAADEQLVAAWSGTTGTANLTVYTTWTFTTGEAGSFEELCRRLGPVGDATMQLGLHPLDVSVLGAVEPWPPTEHVVVDYTGALWDAELSAAGLGDRKEDFDVAVTGLLEQGSHRVVLDLDEPDPVVTPSMYGSFAAATHDIPTGGWLRHLNLAPNRRAAAGLGADVVRLHQERFMATAWQQAGALRETNRQLSVTRLQAEIGRTWRRRANLLDDLQRITVLRPQLTFARDELDQPPRRLLADSSFPVALASPAYLRQARPGGVVSTAARRRTGRGELSSWDSAVAVSFGSPAARRAMRFARIGVPAGTTLPDPRRTPGGPTRRPRPITTAAAMQPEVDIADVAALTASAIRPVTAARARIETRIPALATVFTDVDEHELPTRVRWGPTIDEALVWSLIERSPELLLPGVGEFPNNAVRVVESNTAFVSSFMGGANHEMNRELLWREFPADLRSTIFHRFWDRPDRAARDITPMAEWDEDATLAALGSTGGETVVLLIRGDLIMYYPTVRVLLVEPGTEVGLLPSFTGWIPPDVRFVGWDVEDADAVTDTGSEWRVVLEEQPCEPRFGLDTGDEDLVEWSDLTWDHLTDQHGDHLVVGAGGFPSLEPAPAGATWGLNSAHMARVTYQAPFRRPFKVTDLVGPPS